MTARDVSLSVRMVKYSFADPSSPPFFNGGGGTFCSDHKMSVVAYEVKKHHVLFDLAPIKCGMQLPVWKAW